MYIKTTLLLGGHRARDHMVVGFTTVTITTNVVSLNPIHGEVYSIQHCVIKFVIGFLRVFWFPPPIKLTATI